MGSGASAERNSVLKHRVLIVGRGRGADIRLGDASVSRMHAELVVGGDGTLHVADRSSANGTWIAVDGRWQRVTQRSVTPADRLRLGDARITVAELLSLAPEPRSGYGGSGSQPAGRGGDMDDELPHRPENARNLPQGRVRRNPETGEVIAD